MGAAFLLIVLGWSSLVDVRERRVPNWASVGGTAILVLVAAADGSAASAAGWALAVGLPLVVLSSIRPAGLGMGDAKLAACIGAGLGALAPLALMLGCGAGLAAAWAVPRLRRGVPLAPFLAAGTVATLCLGAAGA